MLVFFYHFVYEYLSLDNLLREYSNILHIILYLQTEVGWGNSAKKNISLLEEKLCVFSIRIDKGLTYLIKQIIKRVINGKQIIPHCHQIKKNRIRRQNLSDPNPSPSQGRDAPIQVIQQTDRMLILTYNKANNVVINKKDVLFLNKRQRIPKGQSSIVNPEKLETQSTQDDDKQSKNTLRVGHQYSQANINDVNKT